MYYNNLNRILTKDMEKKSRVTMNYINSITRTGHKKSITQIANDWLSKTERLQLQNNQLTNQQFLTILH